MLRGAALALGLLLTVLGLGGVGIYLVGVIQIVVNQPADQSWLFWGLSIAAIGATLLIGGVGLLVLWRHLGRTNG